MAGIFKTLAEDEYEVFAYNDQPYIEISVEMDWSNWCCIELKEEDLEKMLELLRKEMVLSQGLIGNLDIVNRRRGLS